jgi:hypothetical protein
LVTAGPDVDPAIIREALQNIAQTSWRARDAVPLRFAPDDTRHPVFRVFGGVGTLANVTFARSALVDPGPRAVVVARYSDGTAALVEEPAGDGRVLVFASDLNNGWNDFPLQPAFVPFVHEALKHLASARRPQIDYVVGELPGPTGRVPGVVALPTGGQSQAGARRVVVNVDPRESDPAPMPPDAFEDRLDELTVGRDAAPRDAAREREDGQRLWQYALLLMVISVAAEGLLGRRLG